MSLMVLLSNIQPTEAPLGLIQRGKASFYSKKFNGRRTAYGERFKMTELTAAHRTLPYNTMVEVTNLDNNKSVVVRINDRGPYSKGRVIDLCYSAAKMLGMLSRGVANVTIRVIGAERFVRTEPVASDILQNSTSQLMTMPVPVMHNN